MRKGLCIYTKPIKENQLPNPKTNLLEFKLFRSVLVLSLFLASKSAFSQNLKLGLKAGLSLPNLSSSGGSEVSKGYKTISGPDFGLVVDYTIADKISIEMGIEWSTQGGQKSGLQAIPASADLAQYF